MFAQPWRSRFRRRDDCDYGQRFRVLREEVRHRCRCRRRDLLGSHRYLPCTKLPSLRFPASRRPAFLKLTWRMAPHILHYVAMTQERGKFGSRVVISVSLEELVHH
jgi:hypothetical protein